MSCKFVMHGINLIVFIAFVNVARTPLIAKKNSRKRGIFLIKVLFACFRIYPDLGRMTGVYCC